MRIKFVLTMDTARVIVQNIKNAHKCDIKFLRYEWEHFVLTMDNMRVIKQINEDSFELELKSLHIEWVEHLEQQELLEISHEWITSNYFLTSRIKGLQKVGESSLTFEPLDELTNDA